MSIKIMAVSDVHSPKYLMNYISSLQKHRDECKEADLVIWAGDMVFRGRVEALKLVLEVTLRTCGSDKKIIAVFGNEEYIGTEDAYMKTYKEIIWLNDSYTVIDLNGVPVAVYGTRGALERPTKWQRKYHPELWQIYAARPHKLVNAVTLLRSKAEYVIVVSHYALTYKTLLGEPQTIWPELGSRQMEQALIDSKPDVAIHGHAHKSRVLEVKVDSVRVYNVALPARNDITFIEL